jgi:hypothetical protein
LVPILQKERAKRDGRCQVDANGKLVEAVVLDGELRGRVGDVAGKDIVEVKWGEGGEVDVVGTDVL